MISYKSARDLIKILTDEVECETNVNVQFCNDESGLQNEGPEVEEIKIQYKEIRGVIDATVAIVTVYTDIVDFGESNIVPVGITISPEPKNESIRELIEEILLRARAANVYVARKGVREE